MLLTFALMGLGLPAGAAPAELLVQDGHLDNVYGAVFSADGRVFATASADRTVRLWVARTGKLLQVVPHESAPLSLAYWTRLGGFFTVTREGVVHLIRPRSGAVTVVASVPHYGPTQAAFAANGTRFTLGSGVGDRQLAVHNAHMRQMRRDLRERRGRHVQVYDAARRKRVAVLPVTTDLYDIAMAPDGATVALATPTSVDLWDVAQRKRRWSTPVVAQKLRFAPDGRTLLASLKRKRDTAVLQASNGQSLRRLTGRVEAVAPDGSVATSYRRGKKHQIEVYTAQGRSLARYGVWSQPSAVAFRAATKTVWVGDYKGRVFLFDAGRYVGA